MRLWKGTSSGAFRAAEKESEVPYAVKSYTGFVNLIT